MPEKKNEQGENGQNKSDPREEMKSLQSELKNLSRQLLKARDMSEQRYLKQRQRELEIRIRKLNAQLKEA